MTIAYPFQSFELKATKDIGSTPVLVFGSINACIVEGIVIANQVANSILYSFYLLREEGEPTPQPLEYPFVSNVLLGSNESVDWLSGKNPIFLRANDTIWAYSDYYNNLFNVFVSYRELKETSGC